MARAMVSFCSMSRIAIPRSAIFSNSPRTHDRLDGGLAAGTVPTKQADDLALADAKGDPLRDVTLAVVGVKVVHVKHERQHPDKRFARPGSRGSFRGCSSQ